MYRTIWEILGIEVTTDVTEIKTAFSKRSKTIHPEDSPEEFMELEKAYRAALGYARMEFRSSATVEVKQGTDDEEEALGDFSVLSGLLSAIQRNDEDREREMSVDFTEINDVLDEKRRNHEVLFDFEKLISEIDTTESEFLEFFLTPDYTRTISNREEALAVLKIANSYLPYSGARTIIQQESSRLSRIHPEDEDIEYYARRNSRVVSLVPQQSKQGMNSLMSLLEKIFIILISGMIITALIFTLLIS